MLKLFLLWVFFQILLTISWLLFLSPKNSGEKKSKKLKHAENSKNAGAKKNKKEKEDSSKRKNDNIRVERLNYKVSFNQFLSWSQVSIGVQRIVEGMKILGKIIAIQPLALLVSLPCQLVGHVPITNVSSQLTNQLDKLEDEDEDMMAQDEEDEENVNANQPLELFEIFKVGQYVQTVVTGVKSPGATADGIIGTRRRLDEVERASQRVELNLVPEQVNAGVSKDDLEPGFVRPPCQWIVPNADYSSGIAWRGPIGRGPWIHSRFRN